MGHVSILARFEYRALRLSSDIPPFMPVVSILARFEYRALLEITILHASSFWFQSSPGLNTGRYLDNLTHSFSVPSFNPRPV